MVTVTSGDGMAIGQPALVWDVESGKLLHALRHDMSIWDVAITPDDRYVVTTSYDNSVALWDIRSGDRIETFAGHSTSVFRALLVDHGRLLVTASSDGVVRLSRVPTAQLVHEWKVSARLSNMEMSHDGRLLALGSNPTDQEGMVEMWDPVVPSWLMTIRVSNGALSPWDGIAFSPDDRSLLTRTKSGDVLTWSLPPTGQELIDQAWARVAKPGGELLTQEQRIRFAIEPP